MHIGIDFDNTIICYDQIFHRLALEQRQISDGFPKNKNRIRDYLRSSGKEDLWTEMQGVAYGKRIQEAVVFDGALDIIGTIITSDIQVSIISHKTRYPYIGEEIDLHLAAIRWLELHGFFDDNLLKLSRKNVFFELTKEEKIRRIKMCRCTHFIDDLPEFLAEEKFPSNVKKILFDPQEKHINETECLRISSWYQIPELIRGII